MPQRPPRARIRVRGADGGVGRGRCSRAGWRRRRDPAADLRAGGRRSSTRATARSCTGASATDQRAIASATKLMTALVAIEELPLRAARARRRATRRRRRSRASTCGRASAWRSPTCCARCCSRAPTTRPRRSRVRAAGSVDAFVARMNAARRATLGLTHTHFANPIGLDDPGNHSSALDLARIARRVLRNDFLAATVDMPRARLTTGARTRIVANRNRLVAREPSIDGVKTGHTQKAGYVLVGAATRKGARLVTRRAGRPVRGRARRRHARAAALRVLALPARARRAPRRDARARRGRALRRPRGAARGRAPRVA